jgi:hypothetical protein
MAAVHARGAVAAGHHWLAAVRQLSESSRQLSESSYAFSENAQLGSCHQCVPTSARLEGTWCVAYVDMFWSTSVCCALARNV